MLSSTSTYSRDLESLLQTLTDIKPNEQDLIASAYIRAEAAHAGQKRKSGEPYFTHCVAVASILAEMQMDAETIAAGLLHDVVEDSDLTIDALRAEFGTPIAILVDGVTKLKNLPIKNVTPLGDSRRSSMVNREMEYIRKMLLTMGDDVRVVLVKLADRLHNMRTLGYMPQHKQMAVAQETMDIFAPLANRLGIWQMKWELEDLAFRYLNPDAYRSIAKALDERRDEREQYVDRIRKILVRELNASKISKVTISARPKHIYSIYNKMTKKGLPLEQIYDIRGMRVLVDTLAECYLALGIVHNLWRPIPNEFDDYIANPKDNFYRSLHTAVHDDEGKTVEVQIRTWEMHEDAEYGIAAHWRYKEGDQGHDDAFEQRLAFLRRLMEFGPDVNDASQFVDTVKSEVFQDRVYSVTPNGDIVDLPVGATPIDFAYHIHTDIGNRCRGAKINGRLVPLNYKLKMGDQVEILTAKRGGPSMDWLNPDLDYAVTSRARSKIRHWLRKQNREKHIVMGREVLERELKRLGVLDKVTFESVARLLSFDKPDDFLAGIGSGDVTGSQITNRVLEDERRKSAETISEEDLLKPRAKSSGANVAKGVSIMGARGLLVNLARCCSPMPGDEIVGYITRGRGVTVHRDHCPNIVALRDVERLIDVSWGSEEEEQRYVVPVEVVAYDREGLLREISTIIADQKVNITSVEVSTRQHIATLNLQLEIASNQQLTRILSKLEMVPSVVEARRRNTS
ncbi:MAG: bifunctional (p)ppGpp synthetase/guanosine-3',5'-bis(diphosphate) 3'-pyrophosphohydrolase [Chloroflexota bacterium]|nr:bifunctional (p)ppGpp synthetase/guanosine-3',5'-bis(diphosphate) 3'-pyrophosphohydrolase [Chloroflexota bacterium]MDE2949539.1 bifunctional (p)ppGpp synthetase/guanosine-3',5'-bis(diphosphate) 3'-pyrophosphohydrolase [Chloroflexota bacterium]